jgi:hypothetical protein
MIHRSVLTALLGAFLLWSLTIRGEAAGNRFEAKRPETAVSTFYLAIAKRDRNLLRSVDPDPAWASDEELAKMAGLIVGFRIVARGPMKSGPGVAPGDMYVRAEEFLSGYPKPGIRHFQLRKTEQGWHILNFNVDND